MLGSNSSMGNDFPNFSTTPLYQRQLNSSYFTKPSGLRALTVPKANYETTNFWDSNSLFPASPTSDSDTATQPVKKEEQPANPTPTTETAKSLVEARLANGMGQLVEGSDKQLLQDVKTLISQKISMASTIGITQKNPAGQIRLLMSAFADAEWFIGNVLADFKGVALPAEAQSLIAAMRAMQASIMTQIRTVIGVNLSDDELKALLQTDPKNTKQNISLNWLIQKDDQMTPQPNQGQTPTEPNQANPKPSPKQNNPTDQDSLYGIQSNPAKYQAALGSANQKIVKEMKSIMGQVSALLQAAEQNPENGMGSLMAAIALLNRGQMIGMVADGLKEFKPSNQSDGAYSDTKAAFDQLLQKAAAIMAKHGIPKKLLLGKADTAPLLPSASIEKTLSKSDYRQTFYSFWGSFKQRNFPRPI